MGFIYAGTMGKKHKTYYMNSITEILKGHYDSVVLEIAKIDEMIASTPNIPIDQLLKHRDRRVKLQEVGTYIKYLQEVNVQQNGQQEHQQSKLIKL